MKSILTKIEQIELSNKILDSESITFYEFLYAMDVLPISDKRFLKHKSHTKYYHNHIALKKPLVGDYEENETDSYDNTTGDEVKKEHETMEQCFKYPNKIPERIKKINEALLSNGHKGIDCSLPYQY